MHRPHFGNMEDSCIFVQLCNVHINVIQCLLQIGSGVKDMQGRQDLVMDVVDTW